MGGHPPPVSSPVAGQLTTRPRASPRLWTPPSQTDHTGHASRHPARPGTASVRDVWQSGAPSRTTLTPHEGHFFSSFLSFLTVASIVFARVRGGSPRVTPRATNCVDLRVVTDARKLSPEIVSCPCPERFDTYYVSGSLVLDLSYRVPGQTRHLTESYTISYLQSPQILARHAIRLSRACCKLHSSFLFSLCVFLIKPLPLLLTTRRKSSS